MCIFRQKPWIKSIFPILEFIGYGFQPTPIDIINSTVWFEIVLKYVIIYRLIPADEEVSTTHSWLGTST